MRHMRHCLPLRGRGRCLWRVILNRHFGGGIVWRSASRVELAAQPCSSSEPCRLCVVCVWCVCGVCGEREREREREKHKRAKERKNKRTKERRRTHFLLFSPASSRLPSCRSTAAALNLTARVPHSGSRLHQPTVSRRRTGRSSFPLPFLHPFPPLLPASAPASLAPP